jgi:hypothetical protein
VEKRWASRKQEVEMEVDVGRKEEGSKPFKYELEQH